MGLDGHVPEQGLNLVEFAIRQVAEAGTGAPQIVRGELVDASTRRGTQRRGNSVLFVFSGVQLERLDAGVVTHRAGHHTW